MTAIDLPFYARAKAACSGAAITMVRRLPFVELVELLEFDRLRLDPPPCDRSPDRLAGVIGTQEWLLPEASGSVPRTGHADIYICSTLNALHEAVLPPDDALLHFEVMAGAIDRPAYAPITGIRIRMEGSTRMGQRRPLLRVDLHTLIQQVRVPAASTPDLFELVQKVVRSRIWVDVTRISEYSGASGSSPDGKGNTECPP